MRLRLILEEFGPELIYLKGEKNIVADAISRIDLIEGEEDVFSQMSPSLHSIAHTFGLDVTYDPESTSAPVKFKNLLSHQQKDKTYSATIVRKSFPIVLTPFMGREKLVSLYAIKIKLFSLLLKEMVLSLRLLMEYVRTLI